MTDAERKALLKFLRATAKEVSAWPSWMREGVGTNEQARVESQLNAVRFDERGAPDRKLPDCPQCDEDELFADASFGRFSCYRCGWEYEQAREREAAE